MNNCIYYHFLSANNAIIDLEREMIKVSRINELNDPFELKPYLLVGPVRRTYYLKIRDELSKEYGLLCFSKTKWCDPLLWGHYADKHKGIALGFEIYNSKILEVEYNEKKLRLKWTNNIKKDKETFLYKLAQRKYINWGYENEYRIWVKLRNCTLINGNRFLPFGKNLVLKEIILGSRFDLKKDTSLKYLTKLCRKLNVTKLTKSREEKKSYKIVEKWTKYPCKETNE